MINIKLLASGQTVRIAIKKDGKKIKIDTMLERENITKKILNILKAGTVIIDLAQIYIQGLQQVRPASKTGLNKKPLKDLAEAVNVVA